MNKQLLTDREQPLILVTHLSGFLSAFGIPLINLVVPLILWRIKWDELPRVAEQAREALNFHLSFTLYLLVQLLLFNFVILFLLMIPTALFWFFQVIDATINAASGRPYEYSMSLRWFS